MINITASPYSRIILKDEFINELITNINHEIKINEKINVVYTETSWRSEQKEQLTENTVWGMTINFNDHTFESQRIERQDFSIFDFKKEAKQIINDYLKTITCKHNKIIRKTYNGREFTNGEAFCETCGVNAKTKEKPFYFEPIQNGLKVIKEGMGSLKYVTKYKWPEKTHLQFGTSGLVIGKENSYTTAFFEAFPDVDGFGTFIRGEGRTPDEAETSSWEKYQKYLNCKEHSFSRNFRGKHRTDGFAICEHCGLKGSNILEPETKCEICDQKTSNKFKNKYLCIKHEIELPFKEHYEENLRIENKHSFKDETINESEKYFETFVEHSARSKYIDIIYNNEKTSDLILRYCYHFENLFNSKILKLKPFDQKKETFSFPNEDNIIFLECLEYFLSKISDSIKLSEKKEKIPGSNFLPKKYLEDD